MTNSHFRRIAAIVLFAFLVTGLSLAQDKKGAHTLMGKVEQVNEAAKGLTVNHTKVEGWMDAMTMMYVVDKPEVLKSIKVGDQIKATVYDGDYTLHDVTVVPAAAKGKSK